MSSKKRALCVRNLAKRYELGGAGPTHPTLIEALLHRVRNPFAKTPSREFWALQDVSFDVHQGDVLGVIGRNGAGKSTLLKVLSRITEPTRGQIDLYGRVGSLLEVGTGFHPELTGRENIFLNGAILGMTRGEIRRQSDAIVDFAEVEQFLETPVKRYSSGMYVRLAFSVAAHLNPEILIVDEVLAVGDAQFQRKCLGKMQDVARGEGRTVLFVSHNMAAVRALCNRAVLMRQGRLVLDADTETAVAAYIKEGGETAESRVVYDEASGAPEARPLRAFVENERGEVAPSYDCARPFTLVLEFEAKETLAPLRVGFAMQTTEGVSVCGYNDPNWSHARYAPGRYRVRFGFPGGVLNEGRYLVQFEMDIPNDRTIIRTPFDLAVSLEDIAGHGELAQKLPGIVRPPLTYEREMVGTLEMSKSALRPSAASASVIQEAA